MKSYLSSWRWLKAIRRSLVIALFLILLLVVGSSTKQTRAASQNSNDNSASFTIVNESSRQICEVYVSPQSQEEGFINQLDACKCKVSKGETFKINLSPGLYKIRLEDCSNRTIFHRENIPVSTQYELHFTENDLQANECFPNIIMGRDFYEKSEFTDAKQKFESALSCYLAIPYGFGEGDALNGIAASNWQLGNFGDALDQFLRAKLIAQELMNPDLESASINGIANVYISQGKYEKALSEMDNALELRRKMMDPSGVAIILNNKGLINRFLEHNDLALQFYGEALDIQRELNDQIGQATTLNNIGIIYQEQKRYNEALDYLNQALALARNNNLRGVEGKILTGTGLVYAYQKNFDKALEIFEQALAIAREVGDRAGEGHVLTNIADVQNKELKQYDEALKTYEQAMDALESVRATGGSEEGRAGFIGRYSTLYQNATDLYHQQGQSEAAFYTSERGRGRSFLDSLSTGYVQLSDQASAELLAAEKDAYAAVQTAQDALAKARNAIPPDAALVTNLEAQLAAAEEYHADTQAAVKARSAQLAALIPGRSAVLKLPEVQALLPENITLISYYVLGDKGTLAFIITHQGFAIVDLPKATPANLSAAVRNLSTWPSLEDIHPAPLRNLYAWLVAPLAEHLNTPLVGIIPHQALHYVPFAALTDGQVYFGEQHTLFELPSASSLPFIQKNAASSTGTGALVFGNPASEVPGLSPLTYAADEAQAVASLLSEPVYLGTEASETRLRESIGGTGLLHLAAHGEYNQTNPLYSVIYLAPDKSGKDDGRLEVHEIYGLDLTEIRLVVLSACQTLIGELSTGDDLVGLTRAFVFAGTTSVIASLWNVDDEATEALMVSFYRHWLQEGMGKGQALQAAQADVRLESRWRSPYYWAPFVLSGDAGQVSQESAVTKTSIATSTAVTAPTAITPQTPEPGQTIPCKSGAILLFALVLLLTTRHRVERR